jgi:hypothetical protein
VRFNLVELAVFSLSLVFVSALVAFALTPPVNGPMRETHAGPAAPNRPENSKSDSFTANAHQESGPWGNLLVRDVQLDLPEEYLGSEMNTPYRTEWVFAGMNPAQTADLLRMCGLTERHVDQLQSGSFVTTANGTVVTPNDELIFALSPEVRAKLYAELARNPANELMSSPISIPDGFFDEIQVERQLDRGAIQALRSLVYRRPGFPCWYFSDFGSLMRRVSSEEQRSLLLKVLSRQSAVGARLRIDPGTDIDQLLVYWTTPPGVPAAGIRPLLESISRVDKGGTVSVLYLLPHFARERLYTYPLPTGAAPASMNCFWSALNFFRETPDDRFADPGYAFSYIASQYGPIERPSRLGDLILFLDKQGHPVHAAVYIAGDLAFTKNGLNWKQPWTLMRLKDLAANYLVADGSSVRFLRSKDVP